LAALFAIGCGSGSTGATSPIRLKSAAVSNGRIRPPYECGAGSLWLPLEWGAVPSETKELAVYMGHFHYETVDGRRKLVVPFADLVSHIRPSVHRIAANGLPEGVSWSFFGRSCPLSRGEKVLQELFAFDRVGDRKMDKRLATRLTEEAMEHRRAWVPIADTAGLGRFIAVYPR
jgi:hypothetical protein